MEKFDYTKPHRLVNGEPVLLTVQEIADRQVEEQAWLAAAPQRALEAAEAACGMDRGQREIAIKLLPPESKRRQRAEAAEAAIAALNIRATVTKAPVQALMDAVTASTGTVFEQPPVEMKLATPS